MSGIKQQDRLESLSASNEKTSYSASSKFCGVQDGGDFKEEDGQKFAGKHYIIDFWGMEALQDIELIESSLKLAAQASAATILHIHLHEFAGAGGITGVALLAESHISIHTWPEYDYAAFDVFMCGDAEPEKAVAVLKEVFLPSRVEVKQILRGKLTV